MDANNIDDVHNNCVSDGATLRWHNLGGKWPSLFVASAIRIFGALRLPSEELDNKRLDASGQIPLCNGALIGGEGFGCWRWICLKSSQKHLRQLGHNRRSPLPFIPGSCNGAILRKLREGVGGGSVRQEDKKPSLDDDSLGRPERVCECKSLERLFSRPLAWLTCSLGSGMFLQARRVTYI